MKKITNIAMEKLTAQVVKGEITYKQYIKKSKKYIPSVRKMIGKKRRLTNDRCNQKDR